jgi:hypothetical protein
MVNPVADTGFTPLADQDVRIPQAVGPNFHNTPFVEEGEIHLPLAAGKGFRDIQVFEEI